jgi:hypothetical protein
MACPFLNHNRKIWPLPKLRSKEIQVTDYEAAALAVQQAALEIQAAALEIQAAALEIQTAGLSVQWAQVGMSGLQALLIVGGLWLMRQGVRHRDRQHEETMAALQQQGATLQSVGEGIRETIARQHEENMTAIQQQGEALRSVSEGIREMGEGIREMIARTRPA